MHDDLLITGSGRGRGNTTIGGVVGRAGGNMPLSRAGQARLNRLTARGNVRIGRVGAADIRANAGAGPLQSIKAGGGPTARARRQINAASAARIATRRPRRRAWNADIPKAKRPTPRRR